MPAKQLKTWAEQAGKTLEEAEEYWEKAKKQANHVFPTGEDHPGYWRYVTSKTLKYLGLDHDKNDLDG